MLGQSYSVSQFIVVYYWSTDLLAQLKKKIQELGAHVDGHHLPDRHGGK